MLLAFLLALQSTVPEKCSVEGRVLRAGSGEPLHKVQLTLSPQGGRDPRPRFTTTDDTGRFSFQDVAPGRYQLSATRNGYVRQEYGQRGSSRALTLERGQSVGDIVFRLTPHGVIAGRVVDADGEPVSDVYVQVLRPGYARGRRQLTAMPGRTTTNDLGEYRIYGLAPGRYYVSATWFSMTLLSVTGGPLSASITSEPHYAPTYFPGTADAVQATPLDLTPGAELRGIDVRLLRVPTIRIRGRVINAVAGLSSRGVTVALHARNSLNASRIFSAPVAAGGTFEIRGVTPGVYYLIAWSVEGEQRYETSQPLDVGITNIEGVELVLAPGVELSGRVRVEGGKVDLASGDLRVSIEPAEDRPEWSGLTRVKEDGSFVVSNLSPGSYRISTWGGPEGTYLKSARLGDVDVLPGLELRPGQPAGQLELVLGANAARVEGVITDDQNEALPGVQVWIIPDSRRRSETRLFQAATTDQKGRFVLRSLAPGEYKLFAWDGLEPGAEHDAEFLQKYEEKGKAVSLREGSRESVPMKLTPVGGGAR